MEPERDRHYRQLTRTGVVLTAVGGIFLLFLPRGAWLLSRLDRLSADQEVVSVAFLRELLGAFKVFLFLALPVFAVLMIYCGISVHWRVKKLRRLQDPPVP